MTDFTVHEIDSAPEEAREVLEKTKASIGFVPNLFGVFAESPAMLQAYAALSGIFDQTSLSVVERQVVLLAASYENDCAYCMAAHTGIAMFSGLQQALVNAIRAGTPPWDEKLAALIEFTKTMVRTRGHAGEEAVAAFLEAGYTKAQVLEVILGVGLKTLSNYTNHLADTPLDDAFAQLAWTKPE